MVSNFIVVLSCAPLSPLHPPEHLYLFPNDQVAEHQRMCITAAINSWVVLHYTYISLAHPAHADTAPTSIFSPMIWETFPSWATSCLSWRMAVAHRRCRSLRQRRRSSRVSGCQVILSLNTNIPTRKRPTFPDLIFISTHHTIGLGGWPTLI